jgi:ERCC4-type nuclease
MNPFDVKKELATMTVLCDTREQDTPRARQRLHRIGVPIERTALSFGDYSVRCNALDLRDQVAIERKMDLSELAQCYCHGRKRFTNEFERARAAGAKLYLLVENGSLDAAYRGKYRSRVTPASFTASMLAWLARYNCQLLFCSEETSGQLIHDILYRELKERLEAIK